MSYYRRSYHPRLPSNPYWTTCKYPATCSCGQAIQAGEEMFYQASSKTCCCKTCGVRWQGQIQDENQMCGETSSSCYAEGSY
jgi:hypothetical protein